MSARAYLIALMAGIAPVLGLTAGFNRVVDPFWYYRDIEIPGLNAIKTKVERFERHVKPQVLAREQPQAIVLGSSLAEIGFDPRNAAFTDDGRRAGYNFAFAGTGWDRLPCYLEYALAHAPVRRVVIGIHPGALPRVDCAGKLPEIEEFSRAKLLLSRRAREFLAPNNLHAEWTIRALRAGKHVLCEKPLASNAAEAEEMAKVARETGLVLSEAFAYRYHPLTARVKEIIARGEIGKVQHIHAQFSFMLPAPNNIRFKYELAGGALMDTGCYPVSLIRHIAEAEPTVERAEARLFAPQVDHNMTADLSFPDGRTAHMECGMLSPKLFRSVLKVKGDRVELIH